MLVDYLEASKALAEGAMNLGQTNELINLSFIIKTSGEIVPAMPDDEEFSPQQIRDYVAGPPELFCETHDGFFLFHNKEGKERGLPPNELASAMYLKPPQPAGSLVGKVFVAHPAHIAAYWKGK
jgi:hypothetical protein